MQLKVFFFSSDISEFLIVLIFIVTVPTPVDKNNKPDLTPLYSASETVGKVLKVIL
jgi:UDP-N-acetyl-D-galactosamine dehydrogenase